MTDGVRNHDELIWLAIVRAQRRRAMLTAAASAAFTLIVVLGTALLVAERRDGTPAATPSDSATELGGRSAGVAASPPATAVSAEIVHVMPPPEHDASLPLAPSSWPERVSLPQNAPTVAEDPVTKALALMQVASKGKFEIFVLGDDGRVRTLGAVLEKTRPPDVGVEPSLPGRQTSLRRDGLRAAFPQPEAVVVVDLTTGESRTYPVPGLNEGIQWHPDGERIVVTRRLGGDLLDTRTGLLTPFQEVYTVVTDDATRMARLQSAEHDSDKKPAVPARLVGVDSETGVATARVVELDARLDSIGFSGYENQRLIAVDAGLMPDTSTSADFASYPYSIAVIDAASGQLRRALAFGMGRAGTRCCHLLGWFDDDNLVVQSDQRLLTWNVRSGALSRLTELDDFANLSLAQP